MAIEIRIVWYTPIDFNITNLPSLADSFIWQSGLIDNPSPTYEGVRISYNLTFNATPVAGDSLRFFVANYDDNVSNPISDAGIGTTEGQISTTANRVAVFQSLFPVREHTWNTSHTATFAGSFDIVNPGIKWQLLIHANGEALSATPGYVRYTPWTSELIR